MTRATITWGTLATALVLIAVAAGYLVIGRDVPPAAAPPAPAIALPTPPPPETRDSQGFLYGRITSFDGTTYEGRLRWGGDQEAFWNDYFNGDKDQNPWSAHVPTERLPKERRTIEILGIKIAHRERHINLQRPFMARFGDLARIESRGRDVRVTLKSGTVFDLDRLGSSDLDDGVRVWDRKRGVVDLTAMYETEFARRDDRLRIRTIELLPTAPLGIAPHRLHGTVRTRQGDFTGFVEWNRVEGVGPDELRGRTAEGQLTVRFDTMRSIARRSRDSALATLLDGREIVLSSYRKGAYGIRRISVDDRRFGRVLISWDAFERVDFSPGGSGPAYGDFQPGSPLTGSATTRDGRHLAGRLVYDLDESETTETLDGESRGVHYSIPFSAIASIEPPEVESGGARRARVILHDGEELQLEGTGDVGERHGGVLVFTRGRERPEYLRWEEIQRIDLDRPAAT